MFLEKEKRENENSNQKSFCWNENFIGKIDDLIRNFNGIFWERIILFFPRHFFSLKKIVFSKGFFEKNIF